MSIVTTREEFEYCWPFLEEAMSKDVGGSPNSKDEVWDMLCSGGYGIWFSPKSACLCEFISRHTRIVSLWATGGAIKEIMGILEPEISTWAVANGFNYIIGSGRAAWERPLSRVGYKVLHTTFAKEL
jgi:hypothetical protein